MPILLPKKFGFTLLEFLLTITLIGIVSIISLPSFYDFYSHTKNKEISTKIIHAIRLAQQSSQALHANIILCSSQDHKNCEKNWNHDLLIFKDDVSDGIIHDENQILIKIHFFADKNQLHLRSYPFYRNYLLFFPHQIPANDDGTIWFCSNVKKVIWGLTLDKMGNISSLKENSQGKIQDSYGKLLDCNISQ